MMLASRVNVYRSTVLLGVAVWCLAAAPAAAQAQGGRLPDNVERKAIDIWSEGTRLSGDLFYPKGARAEDELPAILLTHGWGGVRSHLNRTYAPKFAAGGFVVLAFDYRGWGDSDSKLVIRGDTPEPDEQTGEVAVTALAIREVVDPWDQILDITNALNYLEGEAMIDTDRIGIWGTSYSGGHAIYMGANDARIKAIVAQVGAQDSQLSMATRFADQGGLEYARELAIKRARGELPAIPQGENVVAGLRGTPFVSKMMTYRPVEHAHKVTVPTLIIDAGDEQLFDIRQHGGRVARIMEETGKATVKYVIIPGIQHFDIYSTKFEEASDMALEWFKAHL